MADFPGFLGVAVDFHETPGVAAAAYTHPVPPTFEDASSTGLIVDDPLSLDPDEDFANDVTDVEPTEAGNQNFSGQVEPAFTPGVDFYERFHVLPRSLDLGLVLSTQLIEMEVFSGFREDFSTWQDFINNAGAGIALVGAPSLPVEVAPLHSIPFQLQVSSSGPSFVDSTLDFVFDSGIVSIPIDLERVVLLAVPPEVPYSEFLEWVTNVLSHSDGTEQRPSPRRYPRQFFEWDFVVEDGVQRSRLHNMLFDWQSRTFGVPIWHELTRTTQDYSAGVTSINVASTAFADYRVGGLALIYSSETVFDVLTVNTIGPTSITFDSPTLQDHDRGALVCPLRVGVVVGESVTGSRWPSAAASVQMQIEVTDNVVDLADDSAFPTYNSKVLVDEFNALPGGTMSESFEQPVVRIDGEVGLIEQTSLWPNNKRVSEKTFIAQGKQRLWEVRGLLHHLRGRQVSWYLPDFSDDMVVTQDIASGSATLVIANVGYTRFVHVRQPRDVVRITFADGSVLMRAIIDASEVSVDEESLTLDANFPANQLAEDVVRVEFVEKVRFDSDRIRIDYRPGDHTARVSAPVRSVLE